MEFEYLKDKEWVASVWPWATRMSIAQSYIDKNVRNKGELKTFRDFCDYRDGMTNIATGERTHKWTKVNRRAAAVALQQGTQGIKEHFTRGCPKCNTRGIDIPRERPECKDLPPGLWCPECYHYFASASIHFGKPGFAVAAGPSLDKNIEQLKRVVGKYPIFAVDAALKPLLKIGIKPDYVIALEPDPLLNEAIRGLDTTDIILLALVSTHPEFRRVWKGPVFLYDTPSDGREKKKRIHQFGDIGSASMGGNVSTAMLAIMTGAIISPIIFVGHDFSYKDSYYSKDGPHSMAPVAYEMSTHDIEGNKIYTHGILFKYKQWTDMAVQSSVEGNPLQKFVNATEGGILGTTYYDPQKFVKIRHILRRFFYRTKKLREERRWPSYEECEQNGYVGPCLKCYEYMSLKEAIDKYCPMAVKE